MMHLAEFNIGILKYDWDDPRIAEFQNNLDRVYGLAERSPGYVWHLPPEEMEMAQCDPDGHLSGNPRTASTLSVWETAEALHHFTFQTLHKRFYERGDEWHDRDLQPFSGHRFVMWHVAEGHLPDMAEAVARLAHLEAHGASEHAFGWAHLHMGAQ